MKAIVLAAGRGSRLAPLSYEVPKPLMPVVNTPVIVHVIRWLASAGATSLAIDRTRRSGSVAAYLGDGVWLDTAISWFNEENPLGSGGSMRAKRDFFDGEAVIVCTADMLSTLDLRAMVDFHRSGRWDATIALARVMPGWTGDTAAVDRDGRVSEYRFQPPAMAEGEVGSAGVWVVEPAIVELLPREDFVDFSAFLPELVQLGRVGGFVAGGLRLHDIGEFRAFHHGNQRVLNGDFGIRPSGKEVRPTVWIEEGAFVDPSARLTGPVAIGREVVVKGDVEIRGPAVIGHATRIESGSFLADCVVLPGAGFDRDSIAVGGVHGRIRDVLPTLFRYRPS